MLVTFYEPIGRDSWTATQYFMPFNFKVKLLESGKLREITDRNGQGRIIRSKVPTLGW